MSPALALLTLAVLVAAAMWLSMRVISMSDLEVLPARCRERIMWWHLNVRWLYACCAIIAIGASAMHIAT
jgi:hypothetical protein